jgi:hypothetical protein
MKKYIGLLLVALVAISVQKVSAQSAVAVGTNGVYGYAYGSGSQGLLCFARYGIAKPVEE